MTINSKVELSIIVTHYQNPELLDVCLNSIKKNMQDISHETILVDSESKKYTRELIRQKHREVKMIAFKDNLGYSKIVNRGIRKAKGNFILILNADTIILDDAVSKMLKYIKENKDVGILGPKLLDFANNVQVSCFSNPTLGSILARRTFLGKTKWGERKIKKFLMDQGLTNNDKPKKVDWVQGSALMFRKRAIEKIGFLDEKRFFMYFEDADWCRRFWKKGYKVIYFPKAKVAHYYCRSSKKLGAILDIIFNKYTRIHIISALRYFWKYKHDK